MMTVENNGYIECFAYCMPHDSRSTALPVLVQSSNRARLAGSVSCFEFSSIGIDRVDLWVRVERSCQCNDGRYTHTKSKTSFNLCSRQAFINSSFQQLFPTALSNLLFPTCSFQQLFPTLPANRTSKRRRKTRQEVLPWPK